MAAPSSQPAGTASVRDGVSTTQPTRRPAPPVTPAVKTALQDMGIGYVIFVRAKDADATIALLKKQKARPKIIGRVEAGEGKSCLIN